MNTQPVAFIAFKQFDNLGIGYMASVLSEAGYQTMIIDFQSDKKVILKINYHGFISGFRQYRREITDSKVVKFPEGNKNCETCIHNSFNKTDRL